ncbi:centromere protein T isoform X1 [Syngnathus scovelli]|uniref:centromere protein T isoform X1 n=1 Tax=Syngnathus scovelli TaxID=161590 RepID=UPI00211037C8|nr:centromere protein T isoform X1 [Syngnathus scovelli]
MDSTEDLSARVLVKNILSTEPLRTPVTRSVSKQQRSTSTRSSRSKTKDGRAQTPQDIIRRSMRQKMRESITSQSVTPTKKTASAMLKKSNTLASTSLDESDTPRHLLMNILQTEPIRSPVVREEPAPVEPSLLPSANASIVSSHSSIELSGLDPPNLTSDLEASVAIGLRRKRPRPSLNVTDFEARLREGHDESIKSPVVREESQLPSAVASIQLSGLDLPDLTSDLEASVENGLARKRPRPSLGVTVFEERLREGNDESIKSPVVREESQLPSADAGITSNNPSIALSGMDLPDLTSDLEASVENGLRRTGSHPSLGVTDFEERLKEGHDESIKSPVVREESLLPSTVASNNPSIALSGLDLSNPTSDLEASVANGLTKNRPRPSLNVTTFEERLKDGHSEVNDGTRRASASHALENRGDSEVDLSSPAQEEVGASLHLPEMSDGEENSQQPDEAPPAEVADPTVYEEESEEENDSDDKDELESEEMETPSFIWEKETFPFPTAPIVVKPQASASTEDAPSVKPKQVRKRNRGAPQQKNLGLPKSYLMSTFRHFAKTRVSDDVYPVLRDAMDKFLDRMVEDLETYAAHAGRKIIEVEDAVLLLRRQRHVNDKVPVEVLIEKYLRMEQRKLLIPVATSGNVVVPKMKKY